MKTLVLLLLSFAVALGKPAPPPGVPQSPGLAKEEQSPLVGDLVPVQGHVEVEDPAPQPRLSSKEPQEKVSPVDVKQNQSPPKEQPEVKVEQEVKVKPEDTVEEKSEAVQEGKEELKAQPELEVEQEAEVKGEDKVEEKSEAWQEVQVEQEGKEELQAEPELEVEQEAEVQAEDTLEETSEAAQEVQMEQEVEPEPRVYPESRMESDIQVQPPLLDEAQLQARANYEMQGEEFEPLDDDNLFGDEASDTEFSEEEKPMRAAFLNPNPDVEPQTEEEEEQEGLARMRNYVSDEELQSNLVEGPFGNQDVVPLAANLEEDQQLDMTEQQEFAVNYLPNEEVSVEARPDEEAGAELRGEEEQFFDQAGVEDLPVSDADIEGAGRRILRNPGTRGLSYCSGMVFERKCYQFIREAKRFSDAEFHCQEHFLDGHLASITSPYLHNELLHLIVTQIGGLTHTWVGGVRFLDTGRFIWLDGSYWDYSDWLSGEPSDNTEDCLEVMPGEGKFNDFTCWVPQPFICSYPYY